MSTQKPSQMNSFMKELPFTIHLDKCTDENSVICERVLRDLPQKRLVCAGLWQQKPVLVKLFLDSRSAHRHWSREKAGVEALCRAGIRTPELLFSGHLENGTPALVFDLLGDAQTALDLWTNLTSVTEKAVLLNLLVDLIAGLHDSGLIQKDLHLGNFLLSNRQMFAIDGDAVCTDGKGEPLSVKASGLNLALFFAQLFPVDDIFLDAAVIYYAQLRSMDSMQLTNRVKADLPVVRRKRRHKYVNKSYRTSSEFVRSNVKGQVSISRRDAQGETLNRLLSDPDAFMHDGEILKAGNTCTVVRVKVDDCDWVIKRYNIKNPLHALSRCYRPTRAWTSWGNAHQLKISGIATPRAVAVIEKRFGPLRSTGYYVCDFQEGPLASDFFATGGFDSFLFKEAAQNFVVLFELFRKLGIHHGDCKATNFLLFDNAPCVLDLDAMGEPLSRQTFNRLFNADRRRFLQNWQSRPELQEWFDDQLPR